MSDFENDFERLCECYDSYAALGRAISYNRETVQQCHHTPEVAKEDFREAIRLHREEIQQEHTAAQEVGILAMQVVEILEDVALTEEESQTIRGGLSRDDAITIARRYEKDAPTKDWVQKMRRVLSDKIGALTHE